MAKGKEKKGDKAKKKDKKAARKLDKAARKADKDAAKIASKSLGFRSVVPSVTVNDLEASLRFYSMLGFVVNETWKGENGTPLGYELKSGKTQLMIGQDDFAKGADRKKGEGIRFYYLTKEPVDEVAARLKAAGIALESEPVDQPWGSRTFGIADPDGIKVTVSSAW